MLADELEKLEPALNILEQDEFLKLTKEATLADKVQKILQQKVDARMPVRMGKEDNPEQKKIVSALSLLRIHKNDEKAKNS